jgi:drug/metabolite transporter (DMT)-like permease
VSLGGCLLVVRVLGPEQPGHKAGYFTGDLCVALSALGWAVYSVAGKPVVRRLGGLVTTTWAMVFGAAELVVLWLVLPRLVSFQIIWPAGGAAWAIIAYLAVFPGAIGFLAWYEAMDRIPLVLLNVMQYLTPCFTIVLALVLLDERIDLLNIIGLALILAGVVLSGMPTHQRPPRHV